MRLENMAFLQIMEKLANFADRGGLIKVNDQFFIFIRSTEKVYKKTVTCKLGYI